MRKTITIRTDEALRRRLEERARVQGRTVSEVAREILDRALDDRPIGVRTAHVRGRLKLDHTAGDRWRDSLRQHNWRS